MQQRPAPTKVGPLSTAPTKFRQGITLFGGVSIIGGIMIGSGIFYIGSFVLMRTGMSMGLALLAWLLGGVVSMLGGALLCGAGSLGYPRRCFGRLPQGGL